MGILDGKVAIVTGAGKGIGKAEAITLAKEGAAVTVVARTLKDVEKVAQEIVDLGGQALPIKCDVSVREEVNQVVAATVEKFGGVDILVNNADFLGFSFAPLEEWPEEHIRNNFNVGAMGSYYFMVACLPFMKEKGSGKIINTCSEGGYGQHLKVPVVGYAMGKEAIRALTRQAAMEWGKYKINVNVISPLALTPSAEESFPGEEAKHQAIAGTVPLERWGDAELDVGRSVVYLAGPDSDFVTGCTLSVDGGIAMVV